MPSDLPSVIAALGFSRRIVRRVLFLRVSVQKIEDPVRAGVVRRVEDSIFTSVTKRIADTQPQETMRPVAAGIASAAMSVTTAQYLALVDWTARKLHGTAAPGECGEATRTLERVLQLDFDTVIPAISVM